MKNLVDRYPVKPYPSHDIVPVRAGYQICAPGYDFGPQLRDSWTIQYVCSGCGTVWKDGKSFSVSEGEIFVLRPGETIRVTADILNPWTYIWLGFRSAVQMPGLLFQYDHFPCRELEDLFLEVSECNLRTNRPLEPLLISYIWELIYRLEKKSPGSSVGSKTDAYIEQARSLIHERFGIVSVQQLADELHLNRSYLSRLFKKSTAISLQDYLTSVRMQRARELLLQGLSVSQAALASGYSDIAIFSRAYKSYYKMSPTEYLQLKNPAHSDSGDVKT